MTQLIAIVYGDEARAKRALEEAGRLTQGHVLQLADAVIAVKDAGGGVRLVQSVNTTAMGGAGGAFWGSLVGLIFLSPLAGAAVGAAAGALSGYLTDYGIQDSFMTSLAKDLRPGEAALFLLATQMTEDKVAEAFRPLGGRLLYSSVSKQVENLFGDAYGRSTDGPGTGAMGTGALGTGSAGASSPNPTSGVPPMGGAGVGTAPMGGAAPSTVSPTAVAELDNLGNAR